MIEVEKYDLFIFDFDGTIINTEYFHYLAYINVISRILNKDIEEMKGRLTYEIYEKFAHSLQIKDMENYLYYHFYLENFQDIYNQKHKEFIHLIHQYQSELKYCKGMEELLKNIIESEKEFVIVTNSSIKSIEYFLEMPKFHLLKKVKKIYTKEDFMNKKPHPECYLKVIHDFPHHSRKIGFEDSLRGFHSIYQLNHLITPVFLGLEDYFYYKKIQNDYPHTIFYHLSKETQIHKIERLSTKIQDDDSHQIQHMIQNYMNQIQTNKSIMERAIREISALILNKNSCNNIYLTGMGKSGYVCKKSASTWQSLSIPGIYLDLPNLPHGDFGILKENDMIIFISNSGNTEEIVYILKYLKEKFTKKILTISIVGNSDSIMEKYSDFTYVLNPILESDHMNLTPSTSSCLFMMLLDNIAIFTKKNITKREFQLNHPAGSLGKK